MEALSFDLLLRVAGLIRVERASFLGERLLRFLGPRSRRSRRVLRNLEIVFPEQDENWRKQKAAAMWGQFGRGLAEYAHLPELCKPMDSSRIDLVSHVDTEALRREGRPIVFVAAHLANWNLPAVVGQRIGMPLSVLYRKRKNPYLEAVIERWRNQMPSGFIDVDGRAAKAMIEELRAGHAIGLFIDRHARDGEALPFFGIETPTPVVAARLALKTGAAFVPVRLERLPDVRFLITLGEPIEPDPTLASDRERAKQMTERVNKLFEGWIRERPEQWLSTAKRWPRQCLEASERADQLEGQAFSP